MPDSLSDACYFLFAAERIVRRLDGKLLHNTDSTQLNFLGRPIAAWWALVAEWFL